MTSTFDRGSAQVVQHISLSRLFIYRCSLYGIRMRQRCEGYWRFLFVFVWSWWVHLVSVTVPGIPRIHVHSKVCCAYATTCCTPVSLKVTHSIRSEIESPMQDAQSNPRHRSLSQFSITVLQHGSLFVWKNKIVTFRLLCLLLLADFIFIRVVALLFTVTRRRFWINFLTLHICFAYLGFDSWSQSVKTGLR